MEPILQYLVKVSVSLMVIFIFYLWILRRLTFYSWNRWYLLVYSLLSFLIPFINVYPMLAKNNWGNKDVVKIIPVLDSYFIDLNENIHPAWTFVEWTMLLIGVGILILIVRLVVQQLSFLRIRRSAVLLIDDKVKVYQVDQDIIPFSFGNSIFVNQHQHSGEELNEIIRHEFIHVKQRHTMDILWGEWLCILNWYNPFAWMIRRSIRQNLEFIADNKVLENGIDKKQYQYLLLKVTGSPPFTIGASFNLSSLKKRIAMMNKIKSARVHLLRFLFIIPMLAVLLLAFRNHQRQQTVTKQYDSFQLLQDTIPAKQAKPARPAQGAKPAKPKLPEGVINIHVDDKMAVVKYKNGKVEKYNLNIPAENAAFISKYGEMPEPPAALEPPSAVPALPPSPPTPPSRKYETISDVPGYNEKGYKVTVADNQGECVVIVKNRDNKIVKAITLNEWNDHSWENTAKYGEILPPPPPPRPSGSPVPAPAIDESMNAAPAKEAKPLPGQKPVGVKGAAPSKSAVPVEKKSQEDPLFIIDEVEYNGKASAISKIDPSTIESITILKDKVATDTYGEKGKNGVIKIVIKKNAPANTDIPIVPKPNLNHNQIKDMKVKEGAVLEKEIASKYSKLDFESIKKLKQTLVEAGNKPKNSPGR